MMIAHDNHVCGVITVSDTLRTDALQVVQRLREVGIKHILMMTGDNPRTARNIAEKVGMEEVVAEMLLQHKSEAVRNLVKSEKRVLMVGDGINDAPALVEANVGVAMGLVGTEVAIEAADVALMTDDFLSSAEAIKIGRRTSSTIKQNIYGSVFFNIVGVTFAAFGFLTPVMAVVAHAIADVILFLNSAKLIGSD